MGECQIGPGVRFPLLVRLFSLIKEQPVLLYTQHVTDKSSESGSHGP